MADRDDSLVSTPVILAATFGAAAVLMGVLYTLKSDRLETKVVLEKPEKTGKSVAAHHRPKKESSKEKARQAAEAMQRRRGSPESYPSGTAESSVSRRKKRNVPDAEILALPDANNSLGKGGQKGFSVAALPTEAKAAEPKANPARSAPPAREFVAARLHPAKEEQTLQQQVSVENTRRDEGRGSAGGGDDCTAEALSGGQSKTAKRKQRRKKNKAASESPQSSSGFGTPHTGAAGGVSGGSVTPPSAADAAAIAAVLNLATYGDETPPEEDEFTIVSKQKASRKKSSMSRTANSPGNSTPNLSATSGSTYSGSRFNLLANDTFVR